jgi:membrane-associated phospholipid phosphatase
MDAIYNWGIDIIIFIQKMRSYAMDHFFLAVTAMGNDMFYMLILPLFYWCIDKRQSLRLFYLFMFSSWLNAVTKDLLNQPRPYILNESIKVGTTGGPGIPSGHAQGSLVFWGYLALWVRKRWFSVFCITIIMLIAFSRLYLGVHFPTDILGGWFLGVLILFFGNAVADTLESRISALHPLWILLLGTILPIALSFILPTKYSVSPMGITAGLTGAVLLEKKFVDFIMPTGFKESAVRYLIGMMGLLAIYLGLKFAIPKESRMYLPLVFCQYYLMGLWVGFVAPWIFSKLYITKNRESSPI